MRRVRTAVVLLVLLAMGTAAAAATSATSKSSAPTKLTVWVGWSARELGVFKSVVAEYDKAHPNVQIDVVGSINDNKIVAAIRAGQAPDVVSSFNSYNVGTYCASGGWIDHVDCRIPQIVNALGIRHRRAGLPGEGNSPVRGNREPVHVPTSEGAQSSRLTRRPVELKKLSCLQAGGYGEVRISRRVRGKDHPLSVAREGEDVGQ